MGTIEGNAGSNTLRIGASVLGDQDLDDRELVRKVQAGDAGAFDELVLRYQDRIFNLVYRKLGRYEDARDTAQEVFVRAYRGLAAFKGDSQFFTWLFRIALNTTFTQRRRIGRQHDLVPASLDAARGDDGDDPADPPDPGEGPPRLAEGSEEARAVREAIDELPEEPRTLIVLKDIEGMRYEEIAEVLEMPVGSVKSKLHRARQALKERLERTMSPER